MCGINRPILGVRVRAHLPCDQTPFAPTIISGAVPRAMLLPSATTKRNHTKHMQNKHKLPTSVVVVVVVINCGHRGRYRHLKVTSYPHPIPITFLFTASAFALTGLCVRWQYKRSRAASWTLIILSARYGNRVQYTPCGRPVISE